MQIYNYDTITTEYVGTSTADESPLEPGIFLIPANATEIQAPTTEVGESALFDGSNWNVVEDNRGTVYWEGLGNTAVQSTMSDFGALPDGAVTTQPEPTEEERVATKVDEITKDVQSHLDTTAQTSGYDNIMSACSYASVVNPYQSEGEQFLVWRADVWTTATTLLNDWEAGGTEPTDSAEVVAALPILTLV